MDHNLPLFRFAHAVHSDVISMYMFFNNCRLTNANLFQFENKHFEVVARCLIKWKNTKGFGNNRFIILLLAANVSLKFSNPNNRWVTSAHVAILLFFMQLIEEYLLAIQNLDYS